MNKLIENIKCVFTPNERARFILVGEFTDEEDFILTTLQEPFKFYKVEKNSIYYTTCDKYTSYVIGLVLIKKLKRNTFFLTELSCSYMYDSKGEIMPEKAGKILESIFPETVSIHDIVFN